MGPAGESTQRMVLLSMSTSLLWELYQVENTNSPRFTGPASWERRSVTFWASKMVCPSTPHSPRQYTE